MASTNRIHHTRSVYTNGKVVDNGVHPEFLQEHIRYNAEARQERALFVDGKCVYRGDVSEDQITRMETLLRKATMIARVDTAPYR